MSYIKEILDRCYQEAQERLTAFHYKSMINYVINCSEDLLMPDYSEGTDIVENIRTKMDCDDRFFRFPNTGKFGLSEWYCIPSQIKIESLDSSKRKIASSLQVTRDAAIEARARQDYMLNKHNDNSSEHYRKILDGFIIEAHLKSYFKESSKYSQFYRPPPNEGDIESYSYDDWFLLVPAQNGQDITLRFDAKKRNFEKDVWVEDTRLNEYRFFVVGHIDREEIVIDGFTTSNHLRNFGKAYSSKYRYNNRSITYYILGDRELIPFTSLIVFINHLIDDVPFIWKEKDKGERSKL